MEKFNDKYIIFSQLNEKFCNNLIASFEKDNNLLEKVEIRARAISVLGQIISKTQMHFVHQKELISIFDEVFADVITSIYLAGCALDKPAQIILRRVLELGVSIVYMWDLPHVFFGWKCHDCDLNFNEMLEHLTKPSYVSYIKSINTTLTKVEFVGEKKARKLYRMLSNTIHGKVSTFETNLPDRYTFSLTDFQEHLTNVFDVQEILLNLWNFRFFEYTQELFTEIPAIQRT